MSRSDWTSPRGWAPLVAAFAIVLASGPDLAGQTTNVEAGVGLHLEHFGFGNEDATAIRSISLYSVPFSTRLRVGESVRIEASTAFARGELSRPGGASTVIQGLTDSRIRVLTDLLEGRMTVSGLLVLPTGTDGFTAEESSLAGALAADLLPFRVSSWGTGGGAGGQVSYFQPVGAVGVGMSVGYQVSGEFNPLDQDTFGYRPGPSLSIQGLLDYSVGTAGRAALQLGYHRFGDDEIDGSNLFRSGDRVQARASYAFAAGQAGSGVVYGGYQHRSEGTFLTDPTTRSAQGLIFAGAGMRRPWRDMVALPTAELRVQRREDGEDQGTLAGLGIGLEMRRGGVLLVPQARVRVGSVLLREGVRSNLLGAETGISVRHGGGAR